VRQPKLFFNAKNRAEGRFASGERKADAKDARWIWFRL